MDSSIIFLNSAVHFVTFAPQYGADTEIEIHYEGHHYAFSRPYRAAMRIEDTLRGMHTAHADPAEYCGSLIRSFNAGYHGHQ